MILVTIFLTLAIFGTTVSAATDSATTRRVYRVDDIVVTAARTPFCFDELSRSVDVITRDQIAVAPVHSVAQLLQLTAGVDVRRRGVGGVQADISIRGAGFQQTLILLDGTKVSDPQTGHHNFNLPLSADDIERIEVLKGPGSKLYGPNAMAGVINILTRPPAGTRARFTSSLGDHDMREHSFTLSLSAGPVTHRFAAARREADGYHYNTDYEITDFSYSALLGTHFGNVNVAARYSDKEFGAYNFYSDKFPDQWEATKAAFVTAHGSFLTGQTALTPKLHWRRHDDEFLLKRHDPDFYRNVHTTDQIGGEVQVSHETSWGVTVVGAEWAREQMESSNMGDHSRSRGGLFIEQTLSPAEKFSLVPGASLHRYTSWDFSFCPGLDVGYQVADKTRLYGSVGRAFRIPDYTELYYNSDANLGRPDLKPEHSWTYELGVRHTGKVGATVAAFVRRSEDLIDWARHRDSVQYQVMNVNEMTTFGLEFSTELDPAKWWQACCLPRVRIQCAFLDSDRTSGEFDSKYALDHLRHQASVDLLQTWRSNIHQSVRVRYAERLNGANYIVTDTRLVWDHQHLRLFLEATNLFNASYIEIGSVPMPGRWLRTGVTVTLGE